MRLDTSPYSDNMSDAGTVVFSFIFCVPLMDKVAPIDFILVSGSGDISCALCKRSRARFEGSKVRVEGGESTPERRRYLRIGSTNARVMWAE